MPETNVDSKYRQTSENCAECNRDLLPPGYPKRLRASSWPVSMAVLSSGRGSNLQTVIDFCQLNPKDAKVSAVHSNRRESQTIDRAAAAEISVIPIPDLSMLEKHISRRKVRDVIVGEELAKVNPDVLLLLGYDQIISNSLLERMQEIEAVVVNIHPALLTRTNRPMISTTRGPISVLRGLGATEVAYDHDFPISGITVHQVLPHYPPDVGPIVFQQEVAGPKRAEETKEAWGSRMLQAHRPVLETALERLVHAIGYHNIDASRARFPWKNYYGELPN